MSCILLNCCEPRCPCFQLILRYFGLRTFALYSALGRSDRSAICMLCFPLLFLSRLAECCSADLPASLLNDYFLFCDLATAARRLPLAFIAEERERTRAHVPPTYSFERNKQRTRLSDLRGIIRSSAIVLEFESSLAPPFISRVGLIACVFL